MPSAVVHFEIQADDIERATKFYETVFDWKIERYGEMEYWGIYTGRSTGSDGGQVGINGGLLKRNAPLPEQGKSPNAFVCTMEVDDIDAMITKITAAGGTEQMPKTAVAGMMWTAYYKDTEGNIFGIMQDDPNAK
jgi:predicted enzyme related to lactoylglutathione lyase